MNVRCPQCHTVFRVDPARVPASGVDARCSRCSAVFPIRRPDGADDGAAQATADRAPSGDSPAPGGARPATPESSADATPAPPPAPPDAPTRPSAPGGRAAPDAPAEKPVADGPPPPDARRTGPAGGGGAADGSSFGAQDPDTRARRIARALVSDIMAYHSDRLDDDAGPGDLREAFRDEILKSWEEYVAQVGRETADGTSHFRDALNEILAGGREVF